MSEQPQRPQHLAAGSVVLDPATVRTLATWLRSVRAAVAHRNGGGAYPRRLVDLFEVLDAADSAAAVSPWPHEDVPRTADSALWAPDLIPTSEAAVILNRSPRTARRLAAAGSLGRVVRLGGRAHVSRAAVLEHQEHTR